MGGSDMAAPGNVPQLGTGGLAVLGVRAGFNLSKPPSFTHQRSSCKLEKRTSV